MSKKKTIAEKRLELRDRFKPIMKALDEQGQEMLQAIIDEIEDLWESSDEEGAAQLVATLKEKVEELIAKLPEGEVAEAETLEELQEQVDEELKELKRAMSDSKYGQYGKQGAKSIREQVREHADKIKALRDSKGASLKIEIKAPMTTGTSLRGGYIPMPEYDNEIGKKPHLESSILQDVDYGLTSSTSIVYVDELPKNGDAAFIEEGTLKPQVDYSWEAKTAVVKKVAMTAKLSTEMLEDIDFVTTEVESLSARVVSDKINDGVLNGDGTGANLKGITTQAGGFISTAYASSTSKPNTADAIFAAASQLRDLGYTGHITAYVSSSELNKMRLVKNENGDYMSYGTLLEGITPKPEPNLPAGKMLVGDFTKLKVRAKKEMVLDWGYGTVEDSEGKVKSDWEMNFITLVCEARVTTYTKTNDLNAFVYDDIAVVKAAIATPQTTP